MLCVMYRFVAGLHMIDGSDLSKVVTTLYRLTEKKKKSNKYDRGLKRNIILNHFP